MVSLAPIRIWPPVEEASRSWASPFWIRFMAGSIWRMRISPSGVSWTFFVLRIKRVWSSFRSSVLIDWLTADCDMKSCFEASEKFRVEATW